MSTPATPTARTTVRRLPQRGRYDRATIDAILDEALICHLGFVADGQPYVLPTIHARIDDHLYVHGSPASRMLRHLQGGADVCVTVTLLDGLVLARSAFHHSMNYRSVVVLGRAHEVRDLDDKARLLRALVDRVAPGRSDEVRGPTEQELRATALLAVPLHEASAKVRTGPPVDDEADYELPVWAGVLPLAVHPGRPVPDERLRPDVAPGPSVSSWGRPSAPA